MTIIKTQDLTGAALDWGVAKAASDHVIQIDLDGDVFLLKSEENLHGLCDQEVYRPSTDWSQGGPLIEAHRISVEWYGDFSEWCADTMITSSVNQFGPTPLIAACRAIVAAKLGDEVDVPEELV